MGSSVTLPMLPQAALLRRGGPSHWVDKATPEELSRDVFGARFGVAKRGSETFWGAIGNKVNDIGAAIFARKPGQREKAKNVFAAPFECHPGLLKVPKAVRLLDE